MKEFYELNNIELNIYALNIKTMLPDCFSYKTRPNLSLLEALYMSCSLPLIFQPTYYDNTYYIDYGIIENNPYNLNMDTEKEEIDKERILSINMRNTFLKHEINNESTFIEYLLYFLKNILNKYQKPSKKHKKKHYFERILRIKQY